MVGITPSAFLSKDFSANTSAHAGMFLYAMLIMENLNMCTTREEFYDEMKTAVFPKKIEDA